MATKDPRIDAYIAQSAEFARPILNQIREVVHAACPDVVETMKWSRPHFEYRGLLCGMAAFKEHCSLGFWRGSHVVDHPGGDGDTSMGQFGRLTKVSDLPSKKVLTGYIKKAMQLNLAEVKPPSRMSPRQPKPPLAVPDDLAAALDGNHVARAAFDAFPPSHRREYIEWITEAKTTATRERRIGTAIEWIFEGKPRNWKYMNC